MYWCISSIHAPNHPQQWVPCQGAIHSLNRQEGFLRGLEEEAGDSIEALNQKGNNGRRPFCTLEHSQEKIYFILQLIIQQLLTRVFWSDQERARRLNFRGFPLAGSVQPRFHKPSIPAVNMISSVPYPPA